MTSLAVLGTGMMGAPIARRFARDAAQHYGLGLPLTTALLPRRQEAIALGHGDDDVASAVTAFAETAAPTARL